MFFSEVQSNSNHWGVIICNGRWAVSQIVEGGTEYFRVVIVGDQFFSSGQNGGPVFFYGFFLGSNELGPNFFLKIFCVSQNYLYIIMFFSQFWATPLFM